jgi:peptidoglycan/LPS O-acetylase OafA/YrhL
LRFVFAHLLGASALAAMCAASLLWMTSHWTQRAPEGAGLLSYAPLGFLLPAFAAGAHWLFWRARNRDLQVRIAFGAGVFMLAGFATLATLGVAALSETTRALICALVIATAVALNFVPGVAEAAARPTARRRRRRQLPQQA